MAATFGWLCVETVKKPYTMYKAIKQPPSGGCVLKLYKTQNCVLIYAQPPSGGCVLKHRLFLNAYSQK